MTLLYNNIDIIVNSIVPMFSKQQRSHSNLRAGRVC